MRCTRSCAPGWGKLTEQVGFEADARERWAGWCCRLAAQVGFCWDDLHRLDLLDPEHKLCHAVITWTFQNRQYARTIALIEGVRYYYNVRGLWDERLTINLLRAEAAHQIGDRNNEALALAHHIEIHSKPGAHRGSGQLSRAAGELTGPPRPARRGGF